MEEVRNGQWARDAKAQVAAWLHRIVQRDNRWKERSNAKDSARDRDYQRTLLIKRWLAVE